MQQQSTFQRNALASALATALFSSFAASAQEQTTDAGATSAQPVSAADRDAQTLDAVTVTGSRIKRSKIEGPAPVTIITGEQLKKEGFATVYDALQTLTEAIGNVEQDYNWGQTSVNAYPLNLRNLGPGRSLLLINGHRVTDYPMPYQGRSNFANYNNIPTGIVERIEVLAGSASAIYGSDAMAGVVNVVLKENYDGHQFRAKWGKATRGGRINRDFVFSGGTSGDNWNVIYNLQHFDRGELLARDRPFMDSEDDKDFVTWGPAERALGTAKLFPFTGNRMHNGTTSSIPGVGTVPNYITPPDGACEQYGDTMYRFTIRGYDRNTKAVTTGPTYCAQRVFANWALRTGSEDDSAYLRGTYDFNDSLQGWAALGVWKSTGRFNSFLNAFGSGTFWDPRENGGAGDRRNFVKRFTQQDMGDKDGILTLSKELAVDFSAGLKGTIADRFDWDASVGRAEYEVKEDFPTFNESDMRNFFLGAQQGTNDDNRLPVFTPDYNRFWNPLSPSDVDTFARRGEKKAESWLTQAQFTISGDLFEGWAGPIGFAGVVEAAKQGYKLTPDPKTLTGEWETPFGNIEQGGGERNRYAAGVEFRAPLLESLTANVAGRYDKYDAVRDGAKSTYQAGLEWRPFSNLLVRGSYGTSFRAPDMHYVYALASSGISDFTDYVACAQGGRIAGGCPRDVYKIEDALVERGGTPDLKYEEGESYTVGFVWDAFENFSLSADYWEIAVDNIIGDISANDLLLTEAYCTRNPDGTPGRGFTPDGSVLAVPPSAEWCAEAIRRIDRRGPANVAGNVTVGVNPINRAETQVAGVDVSARYALPDTRLGNWSFNLGYTNLVSYKERGLSTEPLVDTRKTQNPRTKITTSVNWNWEKWNATLLMYQKSGGRDNRWGGCEPLADGYDTMTPIDDKTCVDNEAGSITFGETSARHYERREPRRYFNGSVGYQINEAWKLNLYVSNIFDKIYGDKWCADFAYCVDDPVGREVAGEVIFKF